MPRLRTCSAGLDGMQKGCVSQSGACNPAKPVLRPLLEWGEPSPARRPPRLTHTVLGNDKKRRFINEIGLQPR
jgi:hypothetical protein